ncbi:unknown [Lactobacillus phage Lb338-1]|uniref:DUF559 domain-containing protein n=1 Tax=Lactobacillus phage Lb338-1 TaxID=2892342 RepID=C1KFJ2_9CAUD|nr:homing endonuclease [Lactobacillus phage Lb338-1]ACO37003.1 unknown [Lactobacillus phage Lb338-1]
MKKPKRMPKKVYKSRYYKQSPLEKFSEVLYLFRNDRTNLIYVLAYDPGKEFVNKVSQDYNYSTDLNYATKVKHGYYSEFRLKFIKPDSTYYNFDYSDDMDRLVRYKPKNKERKLSKEFLSSHSVKYSKEITKQLIKSNCDSYGELKVYNWLIDNHIKFLNQEKGHLGCYSPRSGVRLPYDFEVPSLKLVIEVQGIQHYKVTKLMNNTQTKLDKQKARDNYKRNFAEINGYHELELTYRDMEKDSRWQSKLLPILEKYKVSNHIS